MKTNQTSSSKLGLLVLALAAAFAMTVLSGCDRPKTLESVQKDLARKFDAHVGVTADVRVLTDVQLADGMTRSDVTNTIEFKREGGKSLLRQEGKTTGLEIKTDGRSRKFDSTQTSVADGQTVYNLTDAFGTQSVHKMKQDDSIDNLGGSAFFAKLNRMYDLTLGAEETMDGVAVYTINGTARKQDKAILDENVVYKIGKLDGVVRSCEMLTNDGKSKIVMKVTNVRTNVSLATTRFEFKAPPGVLIFDLDEYRRLEAEQKQLQEKAHEAMHEGEDSAAPPTDDPAAKPAEPVPTPVPAQTNDKQPASP